jgi:ADP-heptose:LPS heptosyltransferase
MAKKNLYFGLFHTLGDIIVSTALLRTIKEKYPDSHLVYATSKEYTDVLHNNPDVDEIIACGSHWEIILRANERKYDKVFLPLMTNQIDTLWHQLPPWCLKNGENHNLVDFYASRCNDDLVVTNRRTYIHPDDSHWDQIVSNVPEDKKERFINRPFITMHVMSRNPSKDWSIGKFKELANRIYDKYGPLFSIYQIGGETDPDIDPSVVSSLKGMPLLNTAALIKRSLFHIDIDSGPSFIADSLDVSTICIMGATDQLIAGPIGPNVTFVEPEFRECIGTATHTACATHCLINKPCIEKITVEEVFNKFSEKIEPILKAKNLL